MQNLLSERFHNADYTVLSFQDNYFSQNKNEKFQELLTYIDRHQLTGLIYFGGNFEDVPADSFAALNCPVIFVNTVLPPDNMMTATTYSSVQVNHYETAYWQMESLIKNGHSHICMLISSKIDTSVYRLRWQAYEDALSSHGLSTEYLAESGLSVRTCLPGADRSSYYAPRNHCHLQYFRYRNACRDPCNP